MGGTDENGAQIPLEDPSAQALRKAITQGQHGIDGVLSLSDIVPVSLANNKTFRSELSSWVETLYTKGARQTLLKALAS